MRIKIYQICSKLVLPEIIFYKIKHILYYITNFKALRASRSKQKRVIQLVGTFVDNDAIGNCVLEISKNLTKNNICNYIVCDYFNSKTQNIIPSSFYKCQKNDIIIFHYGGYKRIYKKFYKSTPFKKILFYHNITPSFNKSKSIMAVEMRGKKILKLLSKTTNIAIAVSNYNAKDLIDNGYKRIMVVPVCHNIENLLSFKIKNKKSKKFNLLTVGRITQHKSILEIIKIFDYFQKKINKDSLLYIVGKVFDSKYKKYIDKYLIENKIANKVIFTGEVSTRSLAYYYSIANAYLCMSDHEGFCVPLVESMAFKLPIFAFNSSAIPETLHNSGFLLNTKNPKIVSESIAATLKQKNKIINNCNKEFNVYKKYYTNETASKKLLKIIQSLYKS